MAGLENLETLENLSALTGMPLEVRISHCHSPFFGINRGETHSVVPSLDKYD